MSVPIRFAPVVAAALALAATALPAQGIWDSQLRLWPQFVSYSFSAPVNEKVSQMAVPIFTSVPVLPALTIDVGTAYAMTRTERTVLSGTTPVTTTSELNGLTDTQLRAIYSIGQDLLVVTAGLNIPTGSATIAPGELAAATVIGSDFLTFPVSGFGSGLGMTGGFALARPLGNWNWGFGASMRYAGEYEPFEDASGTPTKFQPGPEVRVRTGIDHPFGTGRVTFGLTWSKFGDDKANAATYNTGDRYIGSFSMNSSLANGTDWTFALWNLFRSSGTLIDQSASPRANITNATLAFGVRGPADMVLEPSLETRVRAEQGAGTSFLGTVGTRLVVNRGGWAIVPGFGFSVGTMESATLTGLRGSLAVRMGR
jgi:hypothetical protein